MSAKIDRRGFLTALAALGASIVLPAKATEAEVNAEWQRLLREPWYFEVDKYGTLVEEGVAGPQTRADVFEDVYLAGIKTVDDLVDQVECCPPLADHFRSLAADELDEIQNRVEEDDDVLGEIDEEDDPEEQERMRGGLMPPAERAALERLAAVLDDPDDGWKAWVRAEGAEGLPRYTKIIKGWLAEPVNPREQEFFPSDWNAQGKALTFFQSTAAEVADELGVVIVEGEHPGSTYFAAELRGSVAEANAVAARLELPFRFRRS